MADANMSDIFKYFSDNKTNSYTMSDFRADWAKLTDQDKADLKQGLSDGSLNY